MAPTEDLIGEIHFAVFMTLRKLGEGWTPPRSFVSTVVRNKVNELLWQKHWDKDDINKIKKHRAEQTLRREEAMAHIHTLTPGEFKVFRLLGLGLTNQEIAETLFISPLTVRTHVKRIHSKCGIQGRAKLALAAYQACYREHAESPRWPRPGRPRPGRVPQAEPALRTSQLGPERLRIRAVGLVPAGDGPLIDDRATHRRLFLSPDLLRPTFIDRARGRCYFVSKRLGGTPCRGRFWRSVRSSLFLPPRPARPPRPPRAPRRAVQLTVAVSPSNGGAGREVAEPGPVRDRDGRDPDGDARRPDTCSPAGPGTSTERPIRPRSR